MTASIPISQIVTINPAVVGTGGNPLSLNTILLTDSGDMPASTLLPFYNAEDVGTYFGTASTEYDLAVIYFNGFENSTKKPGTLFLYGCNLDAARGAWLHGTSLNGMTLTQLQALSGSLTVTIDGSVKTAASINLSAVASFTAAATAIGTALSLSGGQTCTWDAAFSRFEIISGTTGASSTITQCTGTLAAGLGLSAGTLSQGVITATPTNTATEIKNANNDWAVFMTTFEPSTDDALEFATWSNGQNDRYLYVSWDSDTGNLTAENATVFGTQLGVGTYDGTMVVYNNAETSAFVCGMIASIDFDATNGRITAAFKTQSGLAATVDNLSDAEAVLSNYCSYYGNYTAPGAGNVYNILYDGRLPGKWKWVDTYVNQIFLNAQLQLAIFEGLLAVNSAPYNELGYSFIRAWCADPIAQALNNGTIRTGVPLSNAQKAQINSAAGLDISKELTNNGYYLQVLPATAQVRGNRQSPPVNLWYMDGGAIQQITLASIAVL